MKSKKYPDASEVELPLLWLKILLAKEGEYGTTRFVKNLWNPLTWIYVLLVLIPIGLVMGVIENTAVWWKYYSKD